MIGCYLLRAFKKQIFARSLDNSLYLEPCAETEVYDVSKRAASLVVVQKQRRHGENALVLLPDKL